ncbi:hypothetical protein C8R45DRAFT_8150 [Mycena sanguinolenta]|nr:hypothetical protein C8R45DRAFT_8150 [Mycena sanguinolenta]
MSSLTPAQKNAATELAHKLFKLEVDADKHYVFLRANPAELADAYEQAATLAPPSFPPPHMLASKIEQAEQEMKIEAETIPQHFRAVCNSMFLVQAHCALIAQEDNDMLIETIKQLTALHDARPQPADIITPPPQLPPIAARKLGISNSSVADAPGP